MMNSHSNISIGQKMQLTGQNLHNEHAQCDMHGDTDFKGSDLIDPSVDFLFCAMGEIQIREFASHETSLVV